MRNNVHVLSATAFLALFAMPQTAHADARTDAFDDIPGITFHLDVAYDTDDPANQTLDAFVVQGGPSPVIFYYPAGGWATADKNEWIGTGTQGVFRTYLLAGYSVVTVDYRCTQDPLGQGFPAQMQDAARSIQYVRSRAAEWDLDPQRIATSGSSAGGHLAAWIALANDQAAPGSSDLIARQSTRVSCFIGKGPMYLGKISPPPGPLLLALECTQAEYLASPRSAALQTLINQSSPPTHLTSNDPPALFDYAYQGGELSTQPIPATIPGPHDPWHGEALRREMVAMGIEAEMLLTASQRLEFLARHLGASGGGNLAPLVSVSASATSIVLPTNGVTLMGSAQDDGLPDPPGRLTTQWSQASGPSDVVFANDRSLRTNVTFPSAGYYELVLTVSDGALSGTASITIGVAAAGRTNLPPEVNAGADQVITLPASSVELHGTVVDDGNPDPPGAVTTTWSAEGPARVTFPDDFPESAAFFEAAGVYTLRLTADDGAAVAFDELVVRVQRATNNPDAGSGETDASVDVDAFVDGDASVESDASVDVDASVEAASDGSKTRTDGSPTRTQTSSEDNDGCSIRSPARSTRTTHVGWLLFASFIALACRRQRKH